VRTFVAGGIVIHHIHLGRHNHSSDRTNFSPIRTMVLPHLAQICSCSGSSQTTFLCSKPSVSSSLVRFAFRAWAFTGVVFPGSGADASLQASASLKKSNC